MIVEMLRLEEYTRLRLIQAKVFELTPTSALQIILGTNGSGKSSVMKELSPLPADPKDYRKTGSKTIQYRHNKNKYVLKTSFGKDGHSFLMNDEELNPGHTGTVQKALVEEHFGITPEIHRFALGQIPFHDMDANTRRYWLSKFSNCNFDYAMGVYKRVSSRARDFSGALKTMRARLVSETSKIIPREELQSLRDKLDKDYETINQLLDKRIPVEQPSAEVSQEFVRLQAQLEACVQKFRKLKKTVMYRNTDLATIEESIAQNKAMITLLTEKSTQQYGQFEELSKAYDKLMQTHMHSIAETEAAINRLEEQKKELLNKRVTSTELHEDPQTAIRGLTAIWEWLDSAVTEMPVNADLRFSRKTNEELLERLQTVCGVRDRAKIIVDNLNSQLTHFQSLKSQGSIECPSCKHSWIRDYDPVKVRKIEEALVIQNGILEKANTELAEIDKGLDEIKSYFKAYKQYTDIVASWPQLEIFWNYLTKKEIILKSPGTVMVSATAYMNDLKSEVRIKEIEQEISKHLSFVSESDSVKNLDVVIVKRQKDELENEISNNTKALIDKKEMASVLGLWKSEQMEFVKTVETIKSLLDQSVVLRDRELEMFRRECFNAMLRELQSNVASNEKFIRESEMQMRVIDDIEQQIVELERKEKLTWDLAKELSPNEGLIAEGIFGFMKLFVKLMNSIIERVWTYPLKVQPCNLEEGDKFDLDYKFPVLIDDDPEPLQDISKGSTAQKEIINYAFRVAGMKAMQLSTYPMFLDEFGASMDPVHKNATISLIGSLIEEDEFSQLFMISHDAMQYGVMSNAEVCILCSNNVIIPKNTIFNKHVVIE